MKGIQKIYTKLLQYYKRIIYRIYYLVKDIVPGNKIVVNYWIPPKANPENYNIGDDLNRFLIELISGKKVIPYKYSLISRIHKQVNYLCIGSIISQLTNEKSVIWGSGVLSPDAPLFHKPLKVLAVRGPLTRQYLQAQGVPCPEVYGDPAMLLPQYYQPKFAGKKYTMGIIPHYKDKNHPILDLYRQCEDVCLLDVQNYGDYKLFVDTLCSCQFIISSSLHGLILSDAYGIPNIWVRFSTEVLGGDFKFMDYFLSIKRTLEGEPVEVNSFIPLRELQRLQQQWQPPQLKVDQLMECCPFRSINEMD